MEEHSDENSGRYILEGEINLEDRNSLKSVSRCQDPFSSKFLLRRCYLRRFGGGFRNKTVFFWPLTM
ncbi:hypothetical protein BDZ97DRAFT_1339012 [Flammula alnicola]|nr:hypothetical protein BDZ97DRAFT_1339012 [Flammula alnicola]